MREEWAQRGVVEDVNSEGEYGQGQMVMVDEQGRNFFSDPLRFTGGDMAPSGAHSRHVYAYQNDYSDDEETDSDESGGVDVSDQQVALRDKEEALVQSALARIRRAQEKGKIDVKLRQDELVALENRKRRLKAEQEAAAKAKSAQSSRKGSASNGKKSKRDSPAMATVPLSQLGLDYGAASTSGADRPSSRRRSNNKVLNEAVLGAIPGAPGVVVEGADGRITYAPISYSGSPSRPRSSSSLSAQKYGPRQGYGYPGYSGGRHVSDNTRPPSSASASPRPGPHEEGWVDSRRSSLSSQMSHHDPFAYQDRRGDCTPPRMIPEEDRRYYAQPQGSYSQPSGIQYSNVVRAPYGDPRMMIQQSSSDPSMLRRQIHVEEGSEDELAPSVVGGSKVKEKAQALEGKQGVPKRKPVGKKKGKR